MNKVTQACEKWWDTHKDDCSGFAKAVANEIGISLAGQANDIVDTMQTLPWKPLSSGNEAKQYAELGFLVLGGLKAKGHGHVVVVVRGPLNRGLYPTAYWGRLGGTGKKATTINWAWNSTERDQVSYAYHSQP